MRKLNFKYAKAINFLPFGPDGVEFNFSNYGNIVNVIGINLDANPPRSNGAGKSSIPEIVVYGLYGKTIKNHKKIKHGNIVHHKIKKKMYVEVQWDNYRVVRTRKPDALRLWENEDGIWDDTTEKTLGSLKATQELIDQVIGINYETFTNVVIFNDRNEIAFLESEPEQKRIIVENLLSLEIYRQYFEIVKTLKKDLKYLIANILKEKELLDDRKEGIGKRITEIKTQERTWKTNLNNELRKIADKIKQKKQELETTDAGKALSLWETVQESLKQIAESADALEFKKSKAEIKIAEVQEKLDEVKLGKHKIALVVQSLEQAINQYNTQIKEEEQFVLELQNTRGAKCPRCRNVVTDDNCNHATLSSHDKIEELKQKIEEVQIVVEQNKIQLKQKEINITKLSEGIKAIKSKVTEINTDLKKLSEDAQEYSKVPRPDTNTSCLLIEKEITLLKTQGKEKQKLLEGVETPYKEILRNTEEELNKVIEQDKSKDEQLQEANNLMPYYDYWLESFGDSGIRKIVIDKIIPTLNDNIAYWLGPLMSNMLTLEFDNELEPTIQRNPPDGDPFVYYCTSRGEQHTMNLSISQAFSYAMMMSWGTIPSFIFLDEVGSNMDEIAKQGIYNMICELSKERQVFVTTHDPYLLDLLQGCFKLTVQKKNGFTTLLAPEI